MNDAWLNYHHLFYFYATVKEGGMTAAAKKLRLSQPTLSGQIRQMEDSLGEPLFERRGRGLLLTATGHTVYRYAEEIFGLGQELLQAVRNPPSGRLRLAVGVSDALPKIAVYRLLEPVMGLGRGARIDVRDGEVPALLQDLAAHRLDLVLSDTPHVSSAGVRAYNHALGECGVTFFATSSIAEPLIAGFPQSLRGVRMLLPAPGQALRQALDEWLGRLGLVPDVVGEVGDSALMKAFGQAGAGVFAAPTAVATEVVVQYQVVPIGSTEDVREHFWAISAERRVRHPGVAAVISGARRLFG